VTENEQYNKNHYRGGFSARRLHRNYSKANKIAGVGNAR
jgi:tagatose-1,6-bisphosphate aldolase non-catalytic subunit AgaZ/GatZ